MRKRIALYNYIHISHNLAYPWNQPVLINMEAITPPDHKCTTNIFFIVFF